MPAMGNNIFLLMTIKDLVQKNRYPTEYDVTRMRTSLLQDGTPPLNVGDYIASYHTPIEKGDIRCYTPEGYPANLPAPYLLADGRLVLKPVPVGFEPSNADIAWIMVALQSAINQYSRHPYPINWELGSDNSGFGHLYQTIRPDRSAANFVLFKFFNYASPPESGGDPLGQMFLGTILKFIPFGSLIGNTLGILQNMTQGGGSPTNLPDIPGQGSGNLPPGTVPAGDAKQDAEDTGNSSTLWIVLAAAVAVIIVNDDKR